jgi:hypothetical protein
MIYTPTTLQLYERQFGPFVHLSVEEKAIWLRWLQAGNGKFAPFIYDLRVGDGLQMPAGSSSYDISAAYALTTKRIDVVYKTTTGWMVVEVKRRSGLSAIGQLIGYRDLLMKTPDISGDISMLLVTDSLQPDMAGILEQNGISWAVV